MRTLIFGVYFFVSEVFAQSYGKYSSDDVGGSIKTWWSVIGDIVGIVLVVVIILYFVSKSGGGGDN